MPQPHIIVLMADQLRRDVLGCYGGGFGATPNIDALAAESVRFAQHHTNCPLCVPARNSIATGTWPHAHGAIVNAWDPAEAPWGTARGQTYYELLAASGYRVVHAGTDHLRSDPPMKDRHAAIEFIASTRQHAAYLAGVGLAELSDAAFRSPTLDYAAGRPQVVHYTNANTAPWPHEARHFRDLWYADRVVEAIDAADPGQPLALMAMFWAPHCPLTAPEPYYSLYDPSRLDLPPHVGRWTPGHSPMHLLHIPGHLGATYTPAQWRQAWAVYLGLVRLLDDAIGRVVAALRRRGFWDDAVVIFTTDHGEMLGVHRLWQKMCMYDDAVRIPLLIKPPGKVDQVHFSADRSQLTQHLDLAATICDYAGVAAPDRSVGRSLAPIVRDPAASGHDAVFCEFNGNSGRSFQQRCVVTPTHKFIYNHGWSDELYDRAADPGETANLCDAPAPPPEAAALRARLADWMQRTNDCIEMPARGDL
ncbi:MAG: Arylsulfatase [Phycisphaerae bacterium]|nr:Arylsulfatase [Phycisphaerae bacterium]